MIKNPGFFKNRKLPYWTPVLLAVLGAVLYLIQALIYAHTTVPGLDEGSYLLKGYLYVRGIYEPFQPYGPFTNKAPFAFLIPGFAQYIFGPGLRTGRFFSVFLGVLTVLGVWVTARRWGGKWIAAGTVWVFALGSMTIKIQAITASEVIIGSMLAWVCVFVLAEERPLWQIILGSILAVCAVLTRQNMAPLLPLLILYIFWQHGRQKGIWSFIVIAIIFLSVHIYYWPNILAIWAPWLPKKLTPFLDPFRLPTDSTPIWAPSIDSLNRTIAFFQGIRYHFIIAVGSAFALILWSPAKNWKSAAGRRAAIFLAILYFLLFAMHAWAAVASKYEHYSCVYCFSNYLTFFDPIGLLLLVIAFSQSWNRQSSRVIQVFTLFFTLILSTGIGLSLFESVNDTILNMPVPRVSGGKILPGTALLVDLITNKYGLALSAIKKYLALGIGAFVGLGILLIIFIIWRRMKDAQNRYTFNVILINSYLILGFLFIPMINARESHTECKGDLISANEQLGAYLAKIIPPNSLVYWDGGLSFTPMLYVPSARIFPPQINSAYTYQVGGDADTLFRFSHWNEELSNQWKEQADVFIIEAVRYPKWKTFLSPDKFKKYPKPSTAPSCREGSELMIFHRIP